MAIYKGTNNNDILKGSANADSLYGYGGDDILIGGLGNDSLTGGLGTDTYVFSKGDGTDVIFTYQTDTNVDIVKFTDVASTDVKSVYQANNSSDLIIEYGSGDFIYLVGFFAFEAARVEQFQFTDTIWTLADIASRHNGTNGNDTLQSLNGVNNTINGLDGNDLIYNGDGNDYLNGGNGIDTVSYRNASSGVNVNLSTKLATGSGTDTLVNIENIEGSEFDDTLIGDSGNNVLLDFNGNNLLEGGLGNDRLSVGGSGVNTFLFSKGDGNDEISGADNSDIVKFTNLASTDVTALYEEYSDGDHNLILQYGNSQIRFDFFFDTPFPDLATSINKIEFTDTTWTLAYIANHHNGTRFDDELNGLAGVNNTIYGLQGNDLITGADNNDTLNGNFGNDGLIGNDGNDKLRGGPGNDNLDGGNGNDVLRGGLGNDILRGNQGDDTYLFFKGDGKDSIFNRDDGGGADIIKFSNLASSELTAIYDNNVHDLYHPSSLILEYGNGDQILVDFYFSPYTTNSRISQIQFTDTTWTIADIAAHHNGTNSNDTLFGFTGVNNTINGLDGDDLIQGSDGNDHLNGGNGNDTVDYQNAVNATDVSLATGLASGAGTDTLTGFENIKGSQYDDKLAGNADNNLLYGFAGNDWLNGLAGNDTLYGDIGNDTLNGGDGDDIISGGDGDDVLNGGKGVDTVDFSTAANGVNVDLMAGKASGMGTDTLVFFENIQGSNYDDILTGNNGNNVLIGNYGSDTLNGLGGNDIISGGFSGHNHIVAGNGADTINSFGNQNQIDLTETVAATDQVIITDGNSVWYDNENKGYDIITGFALGKGKTTSGEDKLNLEIINIAANTTGFDGFDSDIIRSHAITNGIISFDDTDSYNAALTITENNLTSVFVYLMDNLNYNETVAFIAMGNTYVYHKSFVDLAVQLTGVTATNLNTTGLAMDGVWLV